METAQGNIQHEVNKSTTPCTMKYNTIQYNTIQYNTIQYNTIQYNTIQYNTIQYNTIQYNTIQYNTIQYNTIQVILRQARKALFSLQIEIHTSMLCKRSIRSLFFVAREVNRF